MKKKITLVVALALVLVVGVFGTLAWLTDTTDEIKNTFTVGNVDIDLAETKGGTAREFKMVPGYTIEKDPKVTVKGGSEKCYVFVEVTEGNNLDNFISYDLTGAGWTLLSDDVYYRVVEASTADQTFSVLTNDKVTVKDTVEKTDMDALTVQTYPTLTFKAYAIQYNNGNTTYFSAAEAWAALNPTTTP